jgi:dihydrofolate reductase
VSDTSTRTGKVVVNRAMSLDGFIAGPGDAQDWIFDFMANDLPWQKEAAAATGAMLVGRRTVEVGSRREADQERGTESRDEGYPFSGPVFVLTHRPPDPPDPDVTYLTGDIGEAVAACGQTASLSSGSACASSRGLPGLAALAGLSRLTSDQAPPINDLASAGPTTRSWRSPPTSSRLDCSSPPAFTGSKPAVRISRSASCPARSSSVT